MDDFRLPNSGLFRISNFEIDILGFEVSRGVGDDSDSSEVS